MKDQDKKCCDSPCHHCPYFNNDCEKCHQAPTPLDIRITRLFKKWIVSRPNGNCQVLFALTELDDFVEEIMEEINKELK